MTTDWTRQDVVDLLRRARDLVAAGWCQRQDHARVKELWPNPGSRDLYCLRGALLTAWAPGARYAVLSAAQAELKAVLSLRDPEYDVYPAEGALVAWNDDPMRKQQEVVALLDAAIAE